MRLLALAGPELRDESGRRRLEDENDFVRLEIAAALERKIPIIPVLMENAKMPKASELPDEIKFLANQHGIPLTHDRWDDDMARLYVAIESLTVEPRTAQLYSAALANLGQGRWQAALAEFEAIASIKPNYIDVQERVRPLRSIANKLSQLGPKAGSWQSLVSKYPIIIMVLVCIVPNALTAAFNYLFNWEVIVKPMVNGIGDEAERYFQICAGYINGIGFLLGLAVFIVLARPVGVGLMDIAQGKALPHENLAFLRRRCLLIGHYSALIGVGLWILAGPIYPFFINVLDIKYMSISACLLSSAVCLWRPIPS